MRRLNRFLLGGLLVAMASDGYAGRWHFRGTKSLDLNTAYAGNLFLDSEQETTEESITTARLGFTASRAGGRGNVDIQYAPELRYYSSGNEPARIVHFLDANANAEPIRRLLNASFRARAGQTIIDRTEPATEDGLTTRDNVTNTSSYSFSLSLLPVEFGSGFATLDASTNVDYVVNSDDRAPDSRGELVDIRLTSGPHFSPFSWSLRSGRSLVLYEDANENTLGNLDGSLGVRIARRWFVNGIFGYDESDIDTTRNIDGFHWRVDVSVEPSSRSRFLVGYGKRYDGEDWRLDISTRHKHSSLSAGFTRQIQSARDAFLQSSLFATTDPFGQPIAEPAVDGGSAEPVSGPSQGDALYVSDAFRLAWNWSRRRTRAGLDLAHVRRDDLFADNVTTDLAVGLTLGRRFTPDSSADLRVRWQDYGDEGQPGNDYQQWSGAVNWSYTLFSGADSNMALRLGYQFTVRDAVEGVDFQEDRISLGLITQFK